jgi:N-acetylneuraminate synthase
MSIKIDNREIGKEYPVYFIADIASNHGGDLLKAKELIYACAESGVDAVKMQNFSAETIVSEFGFQHLGNLQTHQSAWKTSVFDSYKAASIPFEWTVILKELTEKLGMAYFTSPYSIEIVKAVAPYVAAFKLGSGDITWHEEIEAMASYNKPLIIATGASDLEEIKLAMEVAQSKTHQIILLQCNTNYTARQGESEESTRERFCNLNLKVLETFADLWPQIPLGLSDHTHGSDSVLGAVGLFGCCVVEKHFTLDNSIEGQDHSFSMMPSEWREMVSRTSDLKNELNSLLSFEERLAITKKTVTNPEHLLLAIGSGVKKVEKNEEKTAIVQRRAVRVNKNLKQGHKIQKEDLIVLRPCPADALPPYKINKVVNRILKRDVIEGDYIKYEDFE